MTATPPCGGGGGGGGDVETQRQGKERWVGWEVSDATVFDSRTKQTARGGGRPISPSLAIGRAAKKRPRKEQLLRRAITHRTPQCHALIGPHVPRTRNRQEE